jgi:hypothetical protein
MSSWASARWAARRCAADMPSSSHSICDAEPTPQARHHDPTRSNNFSRSASVSSFESRTPLTRESTGKMAAPTVSGPAHAPRPTSSMPTTISWPRSHISFSMPRVGARFFETFGTRRRVTVIGRLPRAAWTRGRRGPGSS